MVYIYYRPVIIKQDLYEPQAEKKSNKTQAILEDSVVFLNFWVSFDLRHFSFKSLIWRLLSPLLVWLIKHLNKVSLSGFAGLPYLYSKNFSLWSSY